MVAQREPTTDRDFRIFGVRFWNPDYPTFRAWWNDALAANDARTRFLVIANAHTLNVARKDPEARQALLSADAVINDGIGVRLAARMRHVEVAENLNGTDLIPRLLGEAPAGLRIAMYGASPEVNAKAAAAVRSRFPKVNVVAEIPGYGIDEPEAVKRIAAAEPHLLLVALGNPRQECFIARHREELRARVAVGVGGLFDFMSGAKPRAPQWVQSVGMEWAYRFSREPKRLFQRYIYGNPQFLAAAWLNRGKDRL
jgi:exopolysaccharide biosynthesis WecB/TagA/CpsF family protein